MANTAEQAIQEMKNEFALCNEFVRQMDIAIANDNYDGRTWKYILS